MPDALSCKHALDPDTVSVPPPVCFLKEREASFQDLKGSEKRFFILAAFTGNLSPSSTQGRQNAPSRLGE